MITSQNLTTIVLIIEGILYFLLAALTLRESDFQKQTRRALFFYIATSCLWMLSQILVRLDWLDFLSSRTELPARLPSYAFFLLAMLFLYLSRSFLRLEKAARRWWGIGIGWMAALIILDGYVLAQGSEWQISFASNIHPNNITLGALATSWGAFTALTTFLMIQTYRRTHQPMHRNRIKYWWLVLISTTAGGILFLAGREPVGCGLCLAGAMSATYAVITHDLPDMRQAARRAVSYLLITLLTVAIYTAGFTTMQYLFQTVPGYSPLLAGAAIALILAILFQPLLRLVQSLVNRLIFGTGYDPSHTLRQYSISISNILDLELLANMMIKHIGEALNIQRGRLFLADRTRDQDGNGVFQLRDVGGIGDQDAPEGVLADDSPITNHLHREQRPLLQYDVDLLSRFQVSPEAEQAWLAELDADVYVPIHAKGEWMGLLALGPKASGDRFFDEDLTLLSTLADQTAVALENARLVEGLVHANKDLGHAYADLNKANRQLQELDKLKSAFIGVITHELRTPFANIAFSLELLERHGREHLPEELHEQLEQVAEGVKSAKTMVDNLVTFSTFLSKQGELRLAQVSFGKVVQDSLIPLESLAEANQVTLHTRIPEDLPALQGDQERLADAIYHLVHNAIKFTQSEGEVWVRCHATADAVHLEVQDTGVGVPADKLSTLWEDFAQMADPLRRGVEGLGLGLALVKYVVNAHGGDVWAKSQEGVGSTFGFHIPANGA